MISNIVDATKRNFVRLIYELYNKQKTVKNIVHRLDSLDFAVAVSFYKNTSNVFLSK